MSEGDTDRFSNLPERIHGLSRLAYNLWWSWHPPAQELFRALDPQLWRESEHNPVRMLSLAPAGLLARAAQESDFLSLYNAVMARFETQAVSPEGWFSAECGLPSAPLAYLSAEYGLHASLPVYAGGLGFVAGDYLKECSDLGIPVVAVGIIYSQGYVWQQISEDGWQQDIERTLDRVYDPILPVLDREGKLLTVQVPLFDPPLSVRVWKVAVGRVPLYLMDADLEINQPWERAITHNLYAGNPEQRLRQEIVLGMGGMRVLDTLGICPSTVHINEGHPALAILERIRDCIKDRPSFEATAQEIRASSVFTTHTPLAAGTDVYPFSLMEKYLGGYYDQLGLSREAFFKLGVNPQDPDAGFNLTVFALRMAGHCNAVSWRHGEVARKMWANVWPEKKVEEVPIVGITNGVHLSSWIEPIHLQPLLDRYLGPAWRDAQDLPETWHKVDDIPDEELWHVHQQLKVSLVGQINERARDRWHQDHVAAGNVIAFGALLDPEVLTLGFARRFTSYKRADLILHHLERFKRLLQDPWHPMQIIFAGKAHPADLEGKRLIQKVFHLAHDPEFAGRIAFVENYDQQLAEYMVRGVDVWLNNPLPPMEASGTSGMKASINGVPSLSILDGWWIEGYVDGNGWAFGGQEIAGDRTPADADALYKLLEDVIIPLYYDRSPDEVPCGFVQVMKSAIRSVAPRFSARRMVKEYVRHCYVQALALAGDQEKRTM